MNIDDLREAQARFENQKNQILKDRKELYKLRSSFVKYFDRKRIRAMKIDDYVIGFGKPAKGFNFCYALERQLDGLGRILGSTAFKFGIYYGRTKSIKKDEYRFLKKFGNTHQIAFERVKEAILELLDAGEREDVDAIASNILSSMFKGKILYTYFPEKYLNIFSGDHLNYFLKQLDLENRTLTSSNRSVYRREALINFKNQDLVMKKWTVDIFSTFLYREYPGRPPRNGKRGRNSDPLSDYRIINFPANPSPLFINLDIIPAKLGNTTRGRNNIENGKPDYEKESRKLRRLGDRGEKIVMDLERKRLKDAGKKDLAKKIDRVSLKSDSLGYDILSFEENETKRFIEVKATRSKVGIANFFYTANELRTALE